MCYEHGSCLNALPKSSILSFVMPNHIQDTCLVSAKATRFLLLMVLPLVFLLPHMYVYAETSSVHINLGNDISFTIETTPEGSHTYYNHTDHLGSTTIVTAEDNSIVQQVDYLPFGGRAAEDYTPDFMQSKQYTGHEHDHHTGLDYMKSRYYDSTTAHFISQDPASRDNPNQFIEDPQQMNGYAYARNNSVHYIDPDGRMSRSAMMRRPLRTTFGAVATLAGAGIVSGIARMRGHDTFYPSEFMTHSLSPVDDVVLRDPAAYTREQSSINRYFDVHSDLSVKISESAGFLGFVQSHIKGENPDSLKLDRSVDSNLGFSIQNGTIAPDSVSMVETESGYTIGATITDDFVHVHNTRPGSRMPSFRSAGILANYATTMQEMGVLSPFSIAVEVIKEYSHEEIGIKN